MESLSASVGDSYSKQIRRCTVSNANGVTKTQVYYQPRPRSYSAGSQNIPTASNKRYSAPIGGIATTSTTSSSSSSNAPSPTVKVMRIGNMPPAKLYGKAKSLEDGGGGGGRKGALASPTPNSGGGGGSTMRYKTELCRPFQENGFCKYGDKCQFAHGEQDLRCLPRHPKYKTELCRTYHTRGFCPYGMRCHFIHSIDETRKAQDAACLPPLMAPLPKSPTKRSFSFNMPVSPSLDSGISSPDDYQRAGKYFEFPGIDPSSGSGSGSGSDGEFRDFEQSFDQEASVGGMGGGYVPPHYAGQESLTSPDPFMDLDVNSVGSDSPPKLLPVDFAPEVYAMQELFSHMSMEEPSPLTTSQRGGSSSHRLPVFDDMLNAKSDSALLDHGNEQPVNPLNFFSVA